MRLDIAWPVLHVVLLGLPLGTAVVSAADEFPVVRVTEDDTTIDRSCRIEIEPGWVIADVAGDGAIRIVADDIEVDFGGSVLRGAPMDAAGNALRGVGVRVDGRKGVTLRGLDVRGYKVGLRATDTRSLTIERSAFSGNFRQHLLSTPAAEEVGDWLSPHRNDEGQWRELYGAAISLERSTDATVRDVTVREGQNGIILDRVTESRLYDNDASFLSGWGLALWRSSDNIISRNAFDFCIRGYSHGVYNRGQDSAGILMFEQCSRNVIAENSVTHGGDGFFGHAGREALGESPPPEGFDYRRAGNDENLLVRNDFSDAAAHGIEMTFGFDNVFASNRIRGNAICGVWGGYSQGTVIANNTFRANGDAGYGLERGGINIEHGSGTLVLANQFDGDACGVHLWWDPDEGLLKTPWVKANGAACERNSIVSNAFTDCGVAIHLRRTGSTLMKGNRFEGEGESVRNEGGAEPTDQVGDLPWSDPEVPVLGRRRPVGRRSHLDGRQTIVMTEWGPWDHEGPLVQKSRVDHGLDLIVLGVAKLRVDRVTVSSGGLRIETPESEVQDPAVFRVRAARPGVFTYTLGLRGTAVVDGSEWKQLLTGHVVSTDWQVRVFPWTVDPREDLDGWRAESEKGLVATRSDLELRYGGGGPRDVALSEEIATSGPGADRFGTIATARLAMPAGRYTVRTLS
ncbi:MAG: right-handed parallel beta-helix repeat-containing protein, partial [Planctomycetes bacterium]|nr:right-handed parallel beta-helix repeat-containing protein [Planctomycetota bacterium]